MVRKRRAPAREVANAVRPAPASRTDRGTNAALAAVLVLLACLVYLPALHGAFVWDDTNLIVNNPDVLASDGWWRLWVAPQYVDYFPLTTFTFWLEWRLWGMNTTGYHLVNVVLHACVAVASWQALKKLGVRAAWLGAALFAVHPVSVESVAWIAERKNTLSQLLFVLTILAYLRFEATGRLRDHVLAIGIFVAALLAKTTVVVLPPTLLLIAWWKRGTITRQDLRRTLPFFVLAVAFGLLTIWLQTSRAIGAESSTVGSLSSRIVSAAFALGFYVYTALLPVRLMAIYPEWHRTLPWWQQLMPGLMVLAVLVGLWTFRSTSWARAGLFGLLFFLIGLGPVVGLVDMSFLRATLVADHFQYLSLIGITALLAAAGERYLPATAFRSTAVIMLAIFSVMSWRHAATYESTETLWTDTLSKNPDAWIGHYNLGSVLFERGDYSGAVRHLADAVRLRPLDYANHSSYGMALAANGQLDEAVDELRTSVAMHDHPGTRLQLAHALARLRRFDEAKIEYEHVIAVEPREISAHFNLGRIAEMSGQLLAALQHFQHALSIDPYMAPARSRVNALREQLQAR